MITITVGNECHWEKSAKSVSEFLQIKAKIRLSITNAYIYNK